MANYFGTLHVRFRECKVYRNLHPLFVEVPRNLPPSFWGRYRSTQPLDLDSIHPRSFLQRVETPEKMMGMEDDLWLVVSTHAKNISQIGNLPQIGVKIKNI